MLVTKESPYKRRKPFREFLSRLFREKPLGALGGIIVLVFLFVGIFADSLATHGMLQRNLKHRLEGPSAQFPLGTDQMGRDQYSRLVQGARISMVVGLAMRDRSANCHDLRLDLGILGWQI